MSVNSNFKDLLNIFNARSIKYLVIGGYAVIYYTEPRYTKDLDIWVSTDQDNAYAVFQALQEFGAPLAGMTPADFMQAGCVYQIGVAPVRVDILLSLEDMDFEDAWLRRVETTFDDVPVMLIAKEDLITSKRNASRPQDLIDLEWLTPSEPSAKTS